MQKFLAVICLVCACSVAFSQTLSFSRILLIKPADGNVYVPANKVWKVESVIPNISFDTTPLATSSGTSCGSNTYRNYAIDINGTPTKTGVGLVPNTYSSSNHFNNSATLPIWLPEGTYIATPCPLVSVIEFTVVP